MHTDRYHNKLNIGDKVVTMRKHYSELVEATIVNFTPQQIQVEYDHQGLPQTRS